MPAILVDGLCKTYRSFRKAPGLMGAVRSLIWREHVLREAVRDISFVIEEGEVVGFLGPNGAGKTTTLKMLSGILHPSKGRAEVLGFTPSQRAFAYLRQISMVMGQKSMLWHEIPTYDTLLVHKEIYRLDDGSFRRNLDELVELLAVEDLLRVPVRNLSLGERMKMELLAALLHQPRVLFLDEPTIGLDVVSQARLRGFLRELNRKFGTTIMLTSHYMDDIQALCQRVLLIDHGQLRFDGSLNELVMQSSPYKLLNVTFANTPPSSQALATLDPRISQRPSDDPLRLNLAVPRELIAETTALLLRMGQVADVGIEDVPIEEVIGALFTGQEQIGVAA